MVCVFICNHHSRSSCTNIKLTHPKLKIPNDAVEVAKAYKIETFASRFTRWLHAARSMHEMSRETELQALSVEVCRAKPAS